jgi:hypothetical protein
MPKGTADTTPQTPPEGASDGQLQLEGFEDVVQGFGELAVDGGEPEEVAAVDAGESAGPPQGEAETPQAPAKPEDTPEVAQKVNFDGFSDSQKATFEQLLKAGHVTPEFVESERLNTLFHQAFTKKTMALADERRAWEKEQEKDKEDLQILRDVRSNPVYHAAFLKAAKLREQGDTVAEVGDDELIDRKTAEKIADERLEARLLENERRTREEQVKYQAKLGQIRTAMQETIKALGVPPEVVRSYLEAEEAQLPPGVDPILKFTPEELQYRVMLRHEAAVAKADAASLREQLTKARSHEARVAKQSLPPARRVAQNGALSPLQKTEADLGLDPDWSNVQGFGFRGEQP